MSSKPRTNFPSDGVRTVDPTAKLTKMKWPCCGTIQCSQITYINHRYMKLTLFLLLNNLIFTLRIPVKISGITNLTHKLIFKAWSSPAWNNYCLPSHCAFTCFDFRRQRAGFWFSSVKHFKCVR